jgi:hypothetical protein
MRVRRMDIPHGHPPRGHFLQILLYLHANEVHPTHPSIALLHHTPHHTIPVHRFLYIFALKAMVWSGWLWLLLLFVVNAHPQGTPHSQPLTTPQPSCLLVFFYYNSYLFITCSTSQLFSHQQFQLSADLWSCMPPSEKCGLSLSPSPRYSFLCGFF